MGDNAQDINMQAAALNDELRGANAFAAAEAPTLTFGEAPKPEAAKPVE